MAEAFARGINWAALQRRAHGEMFTLTGQVWEPITPVISSKLGSAIANSEVVAATGKLGSELGEATGKFGAEIGGVFDKLGVTAGFQAVIMGLGITVDTSDSALEKLFADIDANGDGKLTDKEMVNAIAKVFGDAVSAENIAKMMNEADTDKNGTLDLDEFKAIMRAGPAMAPKTAPDSPSTTYKVKRARNGEEQVAVDEGKGGCLVM